MKNLNDKELMNVYGGGFSIGLAFAIGSGVAFLISFLDGIVRPFKCRQENMRELDNKELMNIEGGASWFTSTFLNSISRAISTLMELGRSLGTAIRRSIDGKICPL